MFCGQLPKYDGSEDAVCGLTRSSRKGKGRAVGLAHGDVVERKTASFESAASLTPLWAPGLGFFPPGVALCEWRSQ